MNRSFDWQEWFPKIIGGILLLVTLIFWMVTNRVEPLFVTTGGGLLALGQVAKARAVLRPEDEDAEAR